MASPEQLLHEAWLVNTTNGLLFIASPQFKNRDLRPYSPTLEEVIAGRVLPKPAPEIVPFVPEPEPVAPVTPGVVESATVNVPREQAIKTAVAAVPVEEYAKKGFGFPAMPKVETIEAATGLAGITRAEIEAALPKE